MLTGSWRPSGPPAERARQSSFVSYVGSRARCARCWWKPCWLNPCAGRTLRGSDLAPGGSPRRSASVSVLPGAGGARCAGRTPCRFKLRPLPLPLPVPVPVQGPPRRRAGSVSAPRRISAAGAPAAGSPLGPPARRATGTVPNETAPNGTVAARPAVPGTLLPGRPRRNHHTGQGPAAGVQGPGPATAHSAHTVSRGRCGPGRPSGRQPSRPGPGRARPPPGPGCRTRGGPGW